MDSEAGNVPPRMPRWVKVLGILGAVLVLVLLAVLVFGGSQHGPGRHASPSDSDATSSPHASGNHTQGPTHHPMARGPSNGSLMGSTDVSEPYL